jgi:gas vesicle protein
LRKTDNITLFLAGAGFGLAASLLLAPKSGGHTRKQIGDLANKAAHRLKKRAADLSDAGVEILDDYGVSPNTGRKAMSEFTDDAKDKIGAAAAAAKSAAGQVLDKSREATNALGDKIEQGGRQLQNA